MVAASQFNKERDYWLTRLSGELVKSSFPPSFQQPAPQKPGTAANNMQTVTFRFEGDLFTRLMKLRNGLDSTLHIVLVAGVVLLLEKYTGNNDIIVGTTILKQETEANFINTVLALRNRLEPYMTFKDLLLQVRQTVMEAVIHQNYPIEKLLYQLDIPVDPGSFPLFDTGVILQNIHERNYFRRIDLNILFSFFRNQEFLEGTLEYNILFYDRSSMQRLVQHFTYLMHQVIFNIDMKLSRVQVLSPQELKQILWDFNDTETDYPTGQTLHELFAGQVEKTPLHTAIIHKDKTLTLKQVDASARRQANYLYREKGICPDEIVGILMNNSPELVIAMLGVLKAGGAYVPLDPSLPGERMRFILKDAQVRVVISLKRYIRDLNRLQWECPSFVTFLCMDSWDVYNEEEQERNELMDKKLWEYIGETAVDSITGGGWLTSYTGQPFTAAEMQEYTRNITIKLTPLLHKDMRVLEIGCASGLSMFSLAPMVGFYYGTDLSKVIIEKDKETVREKGLENIRLACLPAHEIEKLEEKKFDLVIMNSVIQSFHGHNYLRKVIGKAIDLMGEKGYIFIGDVMDHDKKTALEQEMLSFKWANRGKGYKTKTDWSSELFVARAFFHDIPGEFPQVKELTFSDKIYTHENELTKFRYDVLMTVEKTANNKENQGKRHKNKFQEDLRALERSDTAWESEFPVGWNHLAYMIYTSGTTGKPRGVMIDQRSLVNYLYWAIKRYTGPGERATFPLYTTPSFDLTVTAIYLPLLTGSPLIIYDQDKQDNGQIPVQEIIEHNAVDLVKATPSHLKILQYTYINSPGDVNRDSPISRSQVRAFIVGGEELTSELARAIYRHFPGKVDIYNEYGPTEATVGCMIHKFNHTADRRRGVPIGVPVDNAKIYLLDESLNAVPIGATGEIYIGGDALARGYLNLPELTAEKFIKNPYLPPGTCHASRLYKTGDLACLIPGDLLEYIGRKDEQVKIRGYRVEIKAIENRLLALEEIDKVVVAAQTDDGGETYLCAYYEAREEVDSSEIRKYLSAGLPGYMIPSYFVRIDRIPLTLNGKVDKKALLGIKTGGRDIRDKYIPPGNRLEETLVDIWARVLKLDKTSISMDADFFELGGHSLKAAILLSRIHKELDVKISFSEIFKKPTIRQLGEFIRGSGIKPYTAIEPLEKKEYYDLSHAQRRLWILNQIDKENIAYNIPGSLEFDTMNGKAFEMAVETLIKHHESLRTTFITVDGKPKQKIHDYETLGFRINYIDLRNEVNKEKTVKILKETEIETPFNLEKGPLLRVNLLCINDNRYLFLFTMHHIISDGWSMMILENELSALYNAFCREKTFSLAPLRIRYKDFAAWHNLQVEGQIVEKHREYWTQKFRGEIPVLGLKADFPRPMTRTFRGGHVPMDIESETRDGLKKLCRENDTGMAILLAAILKTLLYRYTDREDIVIGLPVAGREQIELQNQVGFYINMLPLRTTFSGREESFEKLLARVKQTILEAYEHQAYPFDRLVADLELERNTGRFPLFDVVFQYLNFEGIGAASNQSETSSSMEGVSANTAPLDLKTSKFDLTWNFSESPTVLSGTIIYNADLFQRESIIIMMEKFKLLAREIIAFPAGSPANFEINLELEKILREGSNQCDFRFDFEP
jgi:fengycin family lipopeptide synthetase D